MEGKLMWKLHIQLITQRSHDFYPDQKHRLERILNKQEITDDDTHELWGLINYSREKMKMYNEKMKQDIVPTDVLKYIDLFWVGDSLMHILKEENTEFKHWFTELRNLLTAELARNPAVEFLLVKAHICLIPLLINHTKPELIKVYFSKVHETLCHLIDLTQPDEPSEELEAILTWMGWSVLDFRYVLTDELIFSVETLIHMRSFGKIDVKLILYTQLENILRSNKLDLFLGLWLCRAFNLVHESKEDNYFGQSYYLLQVISKVLDDKRDLLETRELIWLQKLTKLNFVQIASKLLTCIEPCSKKIYILTNYEQYDSDLTYFELPKSMEDFHKLKMKVNESLEDVKGFLTSDEDNAIETYWQSIRREMEKRFLE